MFQSENEFVKFRISAWVPITWWDSKARKSIIFFMSRKFLIINAFRMNMWNTKTTGKLNVVLIVRKNGNPLGKSYIITEYVPQISINPVVLFHFGKLYHTVKVRNILEMIHIHTLLFPTNYLLLNHKLTSTTSHFWTRFTKFKKRACWMRNHLSRWPCTSRCNRVGLIKIFSIFFFNNVQNFVTKTK